MNYRPFHAVRWYCSQAFIIAIALTPFAVLGFTVYEWFAQ